MPLSPINLTEAQSQFRQVTDSEAKGLRNESLPSQRKVVPELVFHYRAQGK